MQCCLQLDLVENTKRPIFSVIQQTSIQYLYTDLDVFITFAASQMTFWHKYFLALLQAVDGKFRNLLPYI